MRASPLLLWQSLFFLLVLGYCLCYAPYGINETDGGFLTGMAWHVLNGKTLYADAVYVRPPLPVWLRALELALLPEQVAILGERWIFYLKVALYSWLGAAVLAHGVRRWQLAVVAVVLSVHCYPPTAWHTVDGLLFGAAAICCLSKVPDWRGSLFSSLFLAAALLCKQSFYPLALLGLLPLGQTRQQHAFRLTCFAAALALFAGYLYAEGLWSVFWAMTTSATSSGQGVQHGVFDYFRIQPALAGLSVVLLAPVTHFFIKKTGEKRAFWSWALWAAILAGSYAWTIAERRDFTVPFAQTRLLFWVAVGWGAWQWRQGNWDWPKTWRFGALLLLCWCASVSWGYNLPVLFAVPWAYAALDISQKLHAAAYPGRRTGWPSALALAALLALFRWGYEWVYRDGPRAAMTEHLGDVFPALGGVYSSPQTAALYRDLADLARRHGPNCTVLPAFPQANFLTDTPPPLPLDWVVAREMGAHRTFVGAAAARSSPVFFIEKTHVAQLGTDPEMAFANAVWKNSRVVEETAFFWVVTGK